MRSSLIVAAKGSVSHGWPSTGTTSVWPERTIPGRAPFWIVANRFAFFPVAS